MPSAFDVPAQHLNGWGPVLAREDDASHGLNFTVENVNRYPPARVGKSCDFTQATQKRIAEMTAKQAENPQKRFWVQAQPVIEQDGYNLVDTKAVKKKNFRTRMGQSNAYLQKIQKEQRLATYQEGILGAVKKPKAKVMPKGKGKGKKGKKGKGKGKSWMPQVPTFREWSVAIKSDWEIKHEITLSNLSKNAVDARKVTHEDLAWCGTKYTFNRSYDKILLKNPKNLPAAGCGFFNPTTTDDELIAHLAQQDDSIDIIATDQILSILMAAPRSIYPWDLVVTKVGSQILIDKRDNSQVDFLSVNENAVEPPSYEDKDSMNSPPKLAQEATRVNQNFSQAVIDATIPGEETGNPHPFLDEDDEEEDVAKTAYRYRKVTLPGDKKADREVQQQDMNILVRCEVNAQFQNGYVTAKCLNELEKKGAPTTWRQHMDTQRGCVLAQEMKNNSCKLARWLGQAMLASCDTLKLGFAARKNQSDAFNHELLNVMTFKIQQFASQLSFHENQAYGILRYIGELLKPMPDGKYVFVKDPTKSLLRLYSVPFETFDMDSEEELDEEDEEEDDE